MPLSLIEWDGVSFTYPGREHAALKPTNLTIEVRQNVAIIGPSGSGKTTALSVLGLLETPSSGFYRFDGVEVGDLGEGTLAALRGRHIGFVFQAFHLLETDSVLENALLGLRYCTHLELDTFQQRARDALATVGLQGREGDRPTMLSGGERQRLAIARAIAKDPEVLLADEPTGNLDPDTADTILSTFRRLRENQGITTVMVTHNPEVAGSCDRVLSVRDGVLVE